MLGAIIGDIVGSVYEFNNIKTKEFEFFNKYGRFTDDTVMSLAVCDALLRCSEDRSALADATVACMQLFGRAYPKAGYGGHFREWLTDADPKPYRSWGNGSAMRVSGCAWAADSLEEALELAKITASVTHDHPEGIKGAQAAAAAVYLARTGSSKAEIRDHIEKNFYTLDFTLDDIREDYRFDVSCQGSVPQAIEAFLESVTFEDAIRNAVSIGGDSDTVAAITGSIAEAFYGIPEDLRRCALTYLDGPLTHVLNSFEAKYGAGKILP